MTSVLWIGLVVIASILWIARVTRNRSDNGQSEASPQFIAALTSALCHAAQLSVLMRDMKPKQIAQLIQKWTGTEPSPDDLAAFIASGRAKLREHEIARIGEGLNDLEKERVMTGAALILGPETNASSRSDYLYQRASSRPSTERVANGPFVFRKTKILVRERRYRRYAIA